MVANPILGVFFHWLGGLASGSFYVPFKGVKKWSWEVYWLTGGFFSWIIVPWTVALIMVPHLHQVLGDQSISTLAWTLFWGILWGFGGLTYGLTMRYLGMSLGTAIVLGLCALFGTYMPPIFDGTIGAKLQTIPGQIILIGMVIALLGIMIASAAGLSKEKEMNEEQKRKSIKEFNLRKGILVAIFSGIMSSCFAYGLATGEPISASALHYGTDKIWTGLPKLIVVMIGGFITNFIWCLYLLLKNKTLHQYISRVEKKENSHEFRKSSKGVHPGIPLGKVEKNVVLQHNEGNANRVPLLANYFFSALAGTVWYFQFFFYTMGETQMGKYQFSSWTLHMASIIIFGSLWGIYLKEWNKTSSVSKFILGLALFTLIASTFVVGYGNLLGLQIDGH